MSSKLIGCAVLAIAMVGATPISAQDNGITAQEALEEARDVFGPPPPMEDCSDANEPQISNEIVVCRRRTDQSQHRLRSDEDAESDYARETMFAGDPQAPDLFGIPDHGPVAARGCFIPPCPPPTAIFIDVEALPEAPPGSDADRIARGLPPLGNSRLDGPQPEATESASPAAPQ